MNFQVSQLIFALFLTLVPTTGHSVSIDTSVERRIKDMIADTTYEEVLSGVKRYRDFTINGPYLLPDKSEFLNIYIEKISVEDDSLFNVTYAYFKILSGTNFDYSAVIVHDKERDTLLLLMTDIHGFDRDSLVQTFLRPFLEFYNSKIRSMQVGDLSMLFEYVLKRILRSINISDFTLVIQLNSWRDIPFFRDTSDLLRYPDSTLEPVFAAQPLRHVRVANGVKSTFSVWTRDGRIWEIEALTSEDGINIRRCDIIQHTSIRSVSY